MHHVIYSLIDLIMALKKIEYVTYFYSTNNCEDKSRFMSYLCTVHLCSVIVMCATIVAADVIATKRLTTFVLKNRFLTRQYMMFYKGSFVNQTLFALTKHLHLLMLRWRHCTIQQWQRKISKQHEHWASIKVLSRLWLIENWRQHEIYNRLQTCKTQDHWQIIILDKRLSSSMADHGFPPPHTLSMTQRAYSRIR